MDRWTSTQRQTDRERQSGVHVCVREIKRQIDRNKENGRVGDRALNQCVQLL